MRVLLGGEWLYPFYEASWSHALTLLGHEVIRFSWSEYFAGAFGRAQNALPLPGPALYAINEEILRTAALVQPEVVLLWRGTHILPSTVRRLRAGGSIVATYNNDDPFGPRNKAPVPWHHHLKWRLYLKSLPEVDLTLVYRPVNVQEAYIAGAKRVHVIMPHYSDYQDFAVDVSSEDYDEFRCDVVFAGHYENDGREQTIETLVSSGLKVKLYGDPRWNDVLSSQALKHVGVVKRVQGAEYRAALCSAKVCLAFLSKMNRDVYTRRCFEIPAMGGLLLSQSTPEMKKILKENVEAVYFSSPEEARDQVHDLISDDSRRHKIAESGSQRVRAEHSAIQRMQQLCDLLEGVKS